MTVRDTNQLAVTTKLYVTLTRPETFDQAGYESTDLVWAQVKQVENFGNHGATRQIVEFTPVDDGVVQKLGGSTNYGNMALVLGNVPGDPGQVILKTASAAGYGRISAKVVYPLGDGETTHETHYLDVIVASFEGQDGAANDVRKVNCTLAICRAPVEIAAT